MGVIHERTLVTTETIYTLIDHQSCDQVSIDAQRLLWTTMSERPGYVQKRLNCYTTAAGGVRNWLSERIRSGEYNVSF